MSDEKSVEELLKQIPCRWNLKRSGDLFVLVLHDVHVKAMMPISVEGDVLLEVVTGALEACTEVAMAFEDKGDGDDGIDSNNEYLEV